MANRYSAGDGYRRHVYDYPDPRYSRERPCGYIHRDRHRYSYQTDMDGHDERPSFLNKRTRDDTVQDGSRKQLKTNGSNTPSSVPVNDKSLTAAQKQAVDRLVQCFGSLAVANIQQARIDSQLAKAKIDLVKNKELAREFQVDKRLVLDRQCKSLENDKAQTAKLVESASQQVKDHLHDLFVNAFSASDLQHSVIPRPQHINEDTPTREDLAALQARLQHLEKAQRTQATHLEKNADKAGGRSSDVSREVSDHQQGLQNSIDKLSKQIADLQGSVKGLTDLDDRLDSIAASVAANTTACLHLKEQDTTIKRLESELATLLEASANNSEAVKAVKESVRCLSTSTHENYHKVKVNLEKVEQDLEVGRTTDIETTLARLNQNVARIESQQRSLQQDRDSSETLKERALIGIHHLLDSEDDATRSKLFGRMEEALKPSLDLHITSLCSEIRLAISMKQELFGAQLASLQSELQRIETSLTDGLVKTQEQALERLTQRHVDLEEKQNVFSRAQNEFRQTLEHLKEVQSRPEAHQSTPLGSQRPQHTPATDRSTQQAYTQGAPQLGQQQRGLRQSVPSHPQNPAPQTRAQPHTQDYHVFAGSQQVPSNLEARAMHSASPHQVFSPQTMQYAWQQLPPQQPPQQYAQPQPQRANATPIGQFGQATHGPMSPVSFDQTRYYQFALEIFNAVSKEVSKPGGQLATAKSTADTALTVAQEALTRVMERDFATASPSAEALREVKDDLHRARDTLDQRIAQQVSLINNIMTNANEGSSRANRAMDKCDDLDKRLGTLERSTTAVGSLLGDGTPRLSTPTAGSPNTSDMLVVRTDLSRLTTEVRTLSATVQSHEVDLRGLQTTTDRLSSDMASLSGSTSQKLQVVSASIDELRPIVFGHSATLDAISDSIATHNKEVKTLPALREQVLEYATQLDDLADLDLPQMKLDTNRNTESLAKVKKHFYITSGVTRNAVVRLEAQVGVERTDFKVQDEMGKERSKEAERERQEGDGGRTSVD
ncbi:hypothetical protein CAC42_1226 [Sphaceloma murrayae]|uniref:Uncharacterized protein n=1 Tax=Sphaceloma murrayae TaxID=2082308 RepID=A0A2K1R2D8_9PEZI|nr:hypothetical protein CAC42_1226 [Sphaceloma murrayae]